MFYFDLTTSARWAGVAVGIVRVERELARRAPIHLQDEVGYCVYDRPSGNFFSLPPKIADDVINQKILIDFSPPPPPPVVPDETTPRRRLRRAVLDHPRLYQLIQRARGRRFSLADIDRISRGLTVAPPPPDDPKLLRKIHLAEVSPTPLDVNAGVTIVTGGLDWEFKDLRAIWRQKEATRFRYAAIVYDMIPLLFPHFLVPGYVEFLTDYFGELMWLADDIMCISQSTERDTRSFCESLGIPCPNSHVFPLGCDISPSDPDQPGDLPDVLEGKRFALFVSTIEPRKNHRMLYEAWDYCVRNGRIDRERHRLVFVGRKGWAVDDLIRELQTNPATKDTIVLLENIPDSQLNALYEACAFTVFPSFYEGYGLPVAEALAHGKPCIASSAGSLAEIGGDLVLRIEPKDTIAWADALATHMTSPGLTKAWETRVRATHRPTTWDDAAINFFDALTRGKQRETHSRVGNLSH